ncbi:helix-turn-helix transcriptional regulator [Lysinibacillus telephonicus]|uniref:helix-turn-helix domain-containing protein n=1 Tax=Lysinibacillus telephonicus TaxID=1714840 RepID=UPI0031FD170A
MQYGDKLRNLREKLGLSQKELTDRLNINRSTYARYETSSTQPDFDTLKKLADFFEVSTDYILGRENKLSHKSQSEKEEAEFQAFINDPELEMWYKELPKSDEEELRKLRTIWEMIKNDKKTP